MFLPGLWIRIAWNPDPDLDAEIQRNPEKFSFQFFKIKIKSHSCYIAAFTSISKK
jgi:hypothetical protein